MIPIIANIKKFSFVNLIFLFCKQKKVNKKKDAIINLKEATPVGEKLFKPIFIAKNADPQIADKSINKKKLFIGNNLFKN